MSTEEPAAEEPVVRYERRGPVAVVTVNRPRYTNAQNSKVTYALDAAFVRAVDDDDEVEQTVFAMAERISAMPRFGLALAKKAVNQVEDLQGMRAGMDSVFGLHHAAHAHNAEVDRDALAGLDARAMAQANKTQANEAQANTSRAAAEQRAAGQA